MAAVKRLRAEEEEEGGAVGVDAAADLLVLLSRGEAPHHPAAARRLFRCKSCSREFPSFQALGGHRAGHKKPRPTGDPAQEAAPPKPRTHECAICGLEFAMGQALGGHMRRHRGLPAVEGFPPPEKRQSAGEKTGAINLDLSLALQLSTTTDVDVDFCALTLGRQLPVVH